MPNYHLSLREAVLARREKTAASPAVFRQLLTPEPLIPTKVPWANYIPKVKTK